MKKYSLFQLLLIFLSGLTLIFIVAPLLIMLFDTSLGQIIETTKDDEVLGSIWLTLWTSMLATISFSIIAIPFSYILSKKDFPFKQLLLGIIDLPIVIPHSAAGIAILGFISRDTAIGKFASLFGLNLVGHPFGIAIAMAFVSIPFVINASRDGFSNVPDRLEKAALNLGASPVQVFFTISLPLAWRNILSGLVMMFARGMSEFGAVVIVAYHPMITPVLIFERFSSFGLNYARPVAIIFIAVSLVVFILMRFFVRKK
ncbi:MAG: ABC transporter permease [Bacteroidetes bacterium]|nr:ABC transporter permease [Bacteroidota bacterium]MBT6686376.1 ABC transporter permease [Bacteroidota bacterium]MBT7142209.1 ABC transporter permease [Bacteroidota bacterium]MBT7490436.1 ABC transporter permease [Bacteroidota bacterium]